MGQHPPNAAMTADNVVTFGAGYHGACARERFRRRATDARSATGDQSSLSA